MGIFPWQTFSAFALGDDSLYFHRQSTKILFKLVGLLMFPLAAVTGPAGHGLKYR